MMTKEYNDPVSTQSRLRIWMAEDDTAVRELLAELLERSDKLQCTRQFSSAEDLVHALRASPPPDLILLDVNLGGMDGIEAIGPIRHLAPETRVFIMTTFYDSLTVTRARNAGASGFFLKRDEWDEAIERMFNSTADSPSEISQPACAAAEVSRR